MVRIPIEYTELQADRYGDGKKVTEELLKDTGSNTERNYEEIDKLWDKTDPELRKWFAPPLKIDKESYGIKLDSGLNLFKFDTEDNQSRVEDFTDPDNFYMDITTATIDSTVSHSGGSGMGQLKMTPKSGRTSWTLTSGNVYEVSVTRPVLEVTEKTVVGNTYTYLPKTSIATVQATPKSYWWDSATNILYIRSSTGGDPDTDISSGAIFRIEVNNADCEGPWKKYAANARWYVGYKRNTTYWATPRWFDDKFNPDNNFPTVLRAQSFTTTVGGMINKVTFNLHADSNSEEPLYLELRNYSDGKPGNTIYCRTSVDLRRFSKAGLYTIPIPFPVKVAASTKYCWVLRSPFTSYANHYGVGGWGKNCQPDPYTGGDAYTSYDNGKTWLKHGRNEKIPYGEGKYAPQDFAFRIHSIDYDGKYPTGVDQYCYFKLERRNPFYKLILSASQVTTDGSIKWEYSTDFKTWTVATLGADNLVSGEPTKLWIRATLSTTNENTCPYVDYILIHTDNDEPLEAYVKTPFYHPRLSQMLGSTIWSRVHAPITKFGLGNNVSIGIVTNGIKEELIPTNGTDTVFYLEGLAEIESLEVYHVPAAGGSYVTKYPYRDFTPSGTTSRTTITWETAPAEGQLMIKYNPYFILGLDETDFNNDPAAGELGLRLDLFTQTVIPTMGQTRFDLLVTPIDPIRVVEVYDTLNPSEGWVDKIDGIDFNPDYQSDGTAPAHIDFVAGLATTDIVRIKYTPDLTSQGLALTYHITRDDETKDVHINPYFFQTRV